MLAAMKIPTTALTGAMAFGCMVISLGAQPATSTAVTNPVLAFKFPANEPLIYSVEIKSKTTSERTAGNPMAMSAQNSLTRNSAETRFKIKFTALSKAPDGLIKVRYEPFDFEQDIDVTSPQGKLTATIRGLEVTGTQNGILVMDTSKNIGLAQAKPLKATVLPLLLSGEMDFDAAGNIRKFRGDLPFTDYWQDKLKLEVGLFDITFPTNAMAVGDTWNVNRTIENMEGLVLSESLSETNTFFRGTNSTDKAGLATITLSAVTARNNLPARVEQMGQANNVSITEIKHEKSGTFHFDIARGCLTDEAVSETASLSMGTLAQGNSITMHIETHGEATLKLLGSKAFGSSSGTMP